MYDVRDFRLVFCADVSDCMVEDGKGELERIAKAGQFLHESLVVTGGTGRGKSSSDISTVDDPGALAASVHPEYTALVREPWARKLIECGGAVIHPTPWI